MHWLLARLGAVILWMTAGGALGWALGGAFGLAWVAAAGGAAAGALAWVALDGARAEQLVRWLRQPGSTGVSEDAGVWGEVTFRVQKAQREQVETLARERDQLAEFLAAIDASPNGVLVLGGDDEILWGNRVAADHLGLMPERDRGQRVTHLVRAPAFVTYLQHRPFGAPVTMPSPAGTGTLQVQARAFGQGRTLVLTQDVTERERADAMRRDFVANVSHEIRTPLTVLAGFVETMQSLPLTEVERRRVLQLMAQQTDRMQLLVSDLLTLAKLEGSPRPPSDQWVPLAAVLARVEAEARTLSGGRHWIDVGDAAGIEIAGNEVELQSAVANLMSNAVRYTPDDGRIALRWHPRAEGGCIEVQDTGVGVAREHIPRLTERFYRVDGSRARETGGTGLGLSIVKHVMQRHGGAIEIDSEPGKGSTFRLVFPASRVRLEAGAALTDPRAATLP